MTDKKDVGYGCTREDETGQITAPTVDYLPPVPRSYRPKIGLIGCGGITEQHLNAYTKSGYDVAAFCDIDRDRAEDRRKTYYPEAMVTTEHSDILGRDDIEVVDLATHPAVRVGLIEEALNAGKHVLSQKPFVLDLDDGDRLVDLAEAKGLKLAVNQNGRWAPHFGYIREAVKAGVIGDLSFVDCAVHWDHNWTAGTSFDEIHHLILYDFSIHWFDFVQTLAGEQRAETVFATVGQSTGQRSKPPLIAQVMVTWPDFRASLDFNGNCLYGATDRTVISGATGTLISDGPGLMEQEVTLINESGRALVALEGHWFPDGMCGTMGELLCSIEERREPSHSARNNLKSLELAFAAASADTGQPVKVGAVRRMS